MSAYDVIVAGGGVAGVSAAVSAARQGARTLLIEGEPLLGGTARMAMIRHICGLYANDMKAPVSAEDTLNPGLQHEVAKMVYGKTGLAPERAGKVQILPLMPETLVSVLEELLSSAGGMLETIKFARLVSAHRGEDGRVSYIEAEGAGRSEAGAFVDATGNAELALLSGLMTHSQPHRQLAGYAVRLQGIDTGQENLNLAVPYALRQAAEKKVVPSEFRFTQFSYGLAGGEGTLKFSVQTREPGLESSFVGFGAESGLERAVDEALVYLSAHVPAFEKAEVMERAGRAVERDAARRADGAYTLTAGDVIASRRFEDEICRNAWPMELWEPGEGPVYAFPSDPGGYGVPSGCLRAEGAPNLFLAGRCVSATREAMGSLRVTGTCIATGEQAGLMAATAALSLK